MTDVKDKDAYEGLVSPGVENDLEKGANHGASILTLVLISMPRVATQMSWAAQWAALGPYLGTMLPNFAVQLTQLIGPITGVLVAPTIGVLSDRSTSKMGRRRPFLIYSAIASCICWIGMGFTRKIAEALGDHGDRETGSRTWTALFTITFYAWMDITVNVVQTPSSLLIADFAGDRQTTGAAIGQAWSTVGSVVVSAYISWFGPAHKSLGYFLGVLCFFMLLTVGIACFAAKEKPLEKVDDNVSAGKLICEAFGSIIQGLKALPGVLVVYAVVFFCVCYGFTAYNGNKGQFFGLVVKNGKSDGADNCDPCSDAQNAYNDGVQLAGGTTDLIYNIVAYALSWTLPWIVAKIGCKWALALSLIPQSLLIVMAFCKVVWIDVVIVVVTSISQTVVFAMVVPVIIHVVGEDAEIGIYVGALNSANCFGQLLNFLIGSALVESSMGYKLPVLVGGCVSLCGFLVCAFFLKIQLYSF